jgi:hypothetical protein
LKSLLGRSTGRPGPTPPSPPQTCLIAALTGSLFYGLPHDALGARSYMGAAFLTVLYQVGRGVGAGVGARGGGGWIC